VTYTGIHPAMPEAERQRFAMSMGYSIGHRLREASWPMEPVNLSVAIWNTRELLTEIEVLYEQLTGVPADELESEELYEHARFIQGEEDTIRRLIEETD
jgi:hypothetical protein